MEIAPGIHRIEAPLGDRFVCVFVLVGDRAVLLVDSGLDDTPRKYIVPYLDSKGIDPKRIRYVITTHADFDHSAGNGSVKEIAPHAVFMCHELDRVQIEDVEALIDVRYGEYSADHGMADTEDTKNFIRGSTRHVPIDVALSGGERIRLSDDWLVDVLHTPGHSFGHVSVYDPRSKTAIIADSALWDSVLTKDGKPAFPPTYRYVETYIGTIQRLQGMRIDALLTSHYPVYKGSQVAEFLGVSRAYVDRVDEALIDLLKAAKAPMTLKELIAALKTKLGSWPDGAEALLNFPLSGHLERLAHYGKLQYDRRDGLKTYVWKS